MEIEKKVTNKDCAKLLGVGQPTVIAVRRMLGIAGARKVFPSHISNFLHKYPDFTLRDAEDRAYMLAFQEIHPDFKLPPAPDK